MSGPLRRAWRQLRWSLVQRGVWATMRVIVTRAAGQRQEVNTLPHSFDVRYGVDTSGFIGGGELSSGGDNDRFTTGYHAIAPSRMDEALKLWASLPGTGAIPEYAFLDVGCGKGRGLMIASEMGFREVIGVELNSGLAEIAERNLERWRTVERAQSPLRVERGDATEAVLPAGPLLLFLYNPFGAPVLRGLLQRLQDEAQQAWGTVDLIYVVPSQEAVFEEFSSFRRLWSGILAISPADAAVDPVSSPEDRCSVYRLQRK